MSQCNEIFELISAAVDGELSPDEQALLDAHLDGCGACSSLFRDLEQLHEAASHPEELEAPAGFTHRVMAAVAADPAQEQPGKVVPFPAKRRQPWMKWAACAAAVVVIVAGAATFPGTMMKAESGDRSFSHLAEDSVADLAEGADSIHNQYEAVPNGGSLKSEDAEEGLHYSSEGTLPGSNPDLDCCGVIALSAELAPPELTMFESEIIADGSTLYTVPADWFFSLAKGSEWLELTYGPPDLPTGRVIVRPQ